MAKKWPRAAFKSRTSTQSHSTILKLPTSIMARGKSKFTSVAKNQMHQVTDVNGCKGFAEPDTATLSGPAAQNISVPCGQSSRNSQISFECYDAPLSILNVQLPEGEKNYDENIVVSVWLVNLVRVPERQGETIDWRRDIGGFTNDQMGPKCHFRPTAAG